MKLKAIAVAAALAVSGSAFAAPTVLVGSNGNINFKNTPVFGTNGSFVDSFTFSLPNLFDKTKAGVTTKMNGVTKDVDFTSIVISTGTQSWAFHQTGFDNIGTGGEKWALDEVLLSNSGIYTMTLTGKTTGGSAYSGNVSFTQAVPEPATYGMMLGGLGLVGLMTRRRKAKAA